MGWVVLGAESGESAHFLFCFLLIKMIRSDVLVASCTCT